MRTRLICLIDDDEIFVFGTKRLMSKINPTTNLITFENGEVAITELSKIIGDLETCPETILLDINMPKMDGWQFLEEFTKLKPAREVSIYMVTSSVNEADQKKAKTFEEVKDYVVKPVTIEGLNRMLHLA